MTPTEEAILRGVEEKLGSFADWQSALHATCEPDGCCRVMPTEREEPHQTRPFMLVNTSGGGGWDMLINLFVMEANDKTASLASCCRAGGVSRDAGLRFIETLADEEIVELDEGHADDGTQRIRLSDRGRRLIEKAMHNFIKSRSGDNLETAFRSIGDAFTNNRIAQEMGVSLRSIESHRANLKGKLR